MKMSEYQTDQGRKFLFVGPPKKGKTLAAASWPGPYICSFDDRLAPIMTYTPLKDRLDRINAKVYLGNYKGFADDINEFANYCPYDTIIIDNLTFMGFDVIDYIIGETRGGKTNKAGNLKGARIGVLEIPGPDEYKGETKAIVDTLMALTELRRNVIMIAHLTEWSQDQLDGTKIVKQSLVTGAKKTEAGVTGFFDEIYSFKSRPPVMSGQKSKFIFTTRTDGNDIASSAYANLPYEIDWTDKNAYDEWSRLIGAPLPDIKKIQANTKVLGVK